MPLKAWKRQLKPRVPVEPGALARRDRRIREYKQSNRGTMSAASKRRYEADKAAIKLSRATGIGIAEARTILAAGAAARPAPVAHDQPARG